MQWSKEKRSVAAVFLAFSVVLTAVGFLLNTATGVLMLCACAVFGLLFALYLRIRDRKIQHMIDEIDMTLHNEEHIYIGTHDEGELSVLQSEVIKMTQRIREQNACLRCEKEHLADSLADIAHQLRTPLTSVNMLLSFAETCEDVSERKAILREADELLSRMDYLLSALLKLSRLDAGIIELKAERFSVAKWVSDALVALEIPLELHNIQLIKSIPPNAEIIGDEAWLAQALQNILKNCMESVGEDGEISILCEDSPLCTRLCVHDSGKGFREEDIPHLFERFYRGKNSKTAGFGIGLALAKTIVSRQDGQLTAVNHPDGGALFTILFYKGDTAQ